MHGNSQRVPSDVKLGATQRPNLPGVGVAEVQHASAIVEDTKHHRPKDVCVGTYNAKMS